MKVLFIPAKSKIDINLLKKFKTKEKIGLVTTIQYLHELPKAKKILKNSIIVGQVIGCNIKNAEKIKNKIDSFLFIGSEQFHPIKIAVDLKKPVHILNPITNKISMITEKEIQEFNKRKKGVLLRFLSAEKLGILVSTKPGQFNLKKALNLQRKLKKEAYIFIFNTVSQNELENFPQIDCWINTACPRIEGKNIINIDDLPKL